MAIPLIAARVLKAIFSSRGLITALVASEAAGAGSKAFTGKSISELAGFTQTGEEAKSLSDQKKEIRKQELFKEIRGDEISAMLPQLGSVADDPIASSRDAAELRLLINEMLPFTVATGVPLESVVGDRGGTALRALLSEKNRDDLDASATEAALAPVLRNVTKEQILGMASSPTRPPSVGPAPPPQVRAPSPQGLQQ